MVVGLIRELFILARRIDHDARAITQARDIKAGDWRAEIGGVIATHEILGQPRAAEFHDDLIAELVQVNRRVRIGQLHDDAPGAVCAAAKVDAADGAGGSAASR